MGNLAHLGHSTTLAGTTVSLQFLVCIYHTVIPDTMGWNSIFWIATRYREDGPGIKYWWVGVRYCTGLLTGVKAVEAWHWPPPFSTRDK